MARINTPSPNRAQLLVRGFARKLSKKEEDNYDAANDQMR
jgi:hypothetical protein